MTHHTNDTRVRAHLGASVIITRSKTHPLVEVLAVQAETERFFSKERDRVEREYNGARAAKRGDQQKPKRPNAATRLAAAQRKRNLERMRSGS